MRWLQAVRSLFARAEIESYAAYWPHQMRTQQIDVAVEKLLQDLSLTEKIAQMSGDGGNFALLKLGIFVFLLKRFPNMYAGKNDRLHIPPLSFTDGPRGVVIGNATCFPAAMTRGASFDTELEQRIGTAIGAEARASGANYFAGLCVNLLRHPAWGRAQETYGEDSHHLGAMGTALMRGVQAQHVMVCAKHFAVNSIENSRFYLDVNIDEKTLHEVYLPHFKTLVENGVDSLMSAYNQINGKYCGHDHHLLHAILREQWQFDGFVSSDWLWGIYETVKPALAGMDIEMPRGHFYAKRLEKAVQRGEVSEETINTSVRRILRKKLHWLSHLPKGKLPQDTIACPQHQQLAQESAEQSIVLLQNNGLLPWSKQQLTGKTIAVIGELVALPCLGDHGSSRVSPPHVVTFLAGLQQYAKDKIRIVYCDGRDIAKAERIASTANTVLLVAGYHAEDEGENLTSNRKPVPYHPTKTNHHHITAGQPIPLKIFTTDIHCAITYSNNQLSRLVLVCLTRVFNAARHKYCKRRAHHKTPLKLPSQ
jgi:beta-glucosidase